MRRSQRVSAILRFLRCDPCRGDAAVFPASRRMFTNSCPEKSPAVFRPDSLPDDQPNPTARRVWRKVTEGENSRRVRAEKSSRAKILRQFPGNNCDVRENKSVLSRKNFPRLRHGHQKTRQENGEETCQKGQEITFGLSVSFKRRPQGRRFFSPAFRVFHG
jgi:hypothetical protein